jgi:DNA-binding GntR family transcriptional regulator
MEYFTKSDVVAAALRELVITGELPPGTELRQRELAARFNVSPTPVREALKRLESEGLVEYDIHRGSRVIGTAFEADEENFLIRASLEGLAVSLAAMRVTEDDLDALELLNDRLAQCGDRDPHASELNRRFHFRLYEAARSPLLLALLRLLWHSFPQGGRIVRPLSESVEQHREILASLRRGDPAGAEAMTRRHILDARPRDAKAAGVRRASANGRVGAGAAIRDATN